MFRFLLKDACELDSFIQKPPNVLLLEDLSFSIFHIATLVIFICAIFHTFMAGKITSYAKSLESRYLVKMKKIKGSVDAEKEVSFWAEICHFFGEVELIFGLWVIPLFFVIVWFHTWKTALEYINTRDYTEPLFIIVIMALAATRPIVMLAEKTMHLLAKLFGGSIGAWWISILTVGPLMGSLITEVGAMTLCAMLLARQFYAFNPSRRLAYATIGLLFVNISVGGILTNFAAPPILIISRCWDWSSLFMLQHFGIKAIIGVVICTLLYWALFRKELRKMNQEFKQKDQMLQREKPVPLWITFVHIAFIVWTVFNSHYPAIFIATFFLFLGFQMATKQYQTGNNIKRPMLVGFFLAGLVIHGGLQGWWITPLMSHLGHTFVMILGVILTAFNDNAAVAYLTSLIPNWDNTFRYAVIAGVVTGGGLTVIANAPNPAGYVILQKYFKDGISPIYLFLSAIVPTLIFFFLFYSPFLFNLRP